MKLGEKPFNSLTPEEMQAWLETLRTERMELRNEAIKEKAIREAKGFTGEAKVKQPRRAVGRPRGNSEADAMLKQTLEMMRSKADE